jgi:Cu(I)/Ag(I) efflux system membrane protein CusA/SilA
LGWLERLTVTDAELNRWLAEQAATRAALVRQRPRSGHHGGPAATEMPVVDPHPLAAGLLDQLSREFADELHFSQRSPKQLATFGGEMDAALAMPGWTNVWTMPIQNRVDMLATGVNTTIGVRVLGRTQNDVIDASNSIALALSKLRGAVNVVADPLRGKDYLEIHTDRDRAAQFGLTPADVNQAVETALAGRIATTVTVGRQRYNVRVRYLRDFREDEQSAGRILLAAGGPHAAEGALPLHVSVSDVALIEVAEGPATIKGENGLLRNYVRLNVRDRDLTEFLEEARRAVQGIKLPEGAHVEWTGRFEHQLAARRLLYILGPVGLLSIVLLLYWTYRDAADAALVMLAVPGALAGGMFCQWVLGEPFSVTVLVGYLACLGMATSTGIVMLVYLREAVEKAGGLPNLTVEGLREAVLAGAVHRLRPKLLTEGTTLIGLAPMLWADGVGAEVIRPMAAPVLGGILIADEVIDLFLPVLFYWVRRRRLERLQSGERR